MNKPRWVGLILLFFAAISEAGEPVLIFFYSINCPHCHHQAQILARLSTETAIAIVGDPIEKEGEAMMSPSKYDLELYRKLKIYALPTIVLVLPDNSVEIVAKGFVDYDTLKAKIDLLLTK